MRDLSERSTVHSPLQHRDKVVLAAPTQSWSASDGEMVAGGAHGLFHGDWRYVRRIAVLINGLPVEPIATHDEHGSTIFRGIAREPATGRPAARVSVERMRTVHSGGMVERVTLINGRDEPLDAHIEIVCEIEFAPLGTVRDGAPEPVATALEAEGDEAIATDGIRTLRISGTGISGQGGRVQIDGERVLVSHHARVSPDDWASISLELEPIDPTLPVHGTECGQPCEALLETGRPALDRWSARAMADLENLLLDAGHGAFPAAGAPWHMTMVARDALIACRLLLPLGGQLAEGTLRTLAARQGVRFDPATGEEPGRILHEMRQGATDALRAGVEAPPVYAGSVDATPLWIVLLHDAWRAGLPLETVRELRTALHAALGWMDAHTRIDFLSCTGEPGMGAAGKGWAGDIDGMRFGTRETGVATAQVQALACRAAVAAAALLDALGDDGEPWLVWAERLRVRFREEFWVERGGTRFPAMALASDGGPVETLTSDIGQLLGTTLLSPAEEAEVAALLLDERLSSGFGLRTMATDAERYWPLAHYCGAIWPHDTAIAIEGLLRAGLHEPARELAAQLERAAEAFDGRMPEVYAGYGLDEAPRPVPYPGACSPQAWSAASVVPVHTALSTTVDALQPVAPEPRLIALTPPSAPNEPEPLRINDGVPSRSRGHLHLVPSSEPAPSLR